MNTQLLDGLVTKHLMNGVAGHYSNNAAHAMMIVAKYRMEFLATITVTDHMTIVSLSCLTGKYAPVTLHEQKEEFNDPIASAISKAYLTALGIDYEGKNDSH